MSINFVQLFSFSLLIINIKWCIIKITNYVENFGGLEMGKYAITYDIGTTGV